MRTESVADAGEGEGEDGGAVAPIRISVVVDAPAERAFEVFTRDIGSWWPAGTHSIESDRVTEVVLECHEGGRILEIHADSTAAPWGVITSWEPPTRLRFSVESELRGPPRYGGRGRVRRRIGRADQGGTGASPLGAPR